jgi:fibronectin type 3 domain-containing protein
MAQKPGIKEKTMKKGLICAVIAAVVLMVLFPACGPSEVKVVELAKSSAPSNVSATFATAAGIKTLTIKWEAADNATGYDVYAQKDGERDIFTDVSGYSVTKSGNVYTAVLADSYGYIFTTLGDLPPAKYRFGVIAEGYSSMQPSDIVWSDYVTIN